ncbi:MAG: HAMP domain-containing sensor histidine kinase [Myxococcota bacterium]|nr:HAMP domain-containing sensor histidine kinase [Myxococcota bacterium]
MEGSDLDAVFRRYVQHHAPVVFLLLDRSGKILNSSPQTTRMLGRDVTGETLSDLFFTARNDFDFTTLLQDHERTHLLTLNTFIDFPETLYFRFFDLGDQIAALGAVDFAEQEKLRKEFLSLNNELLNLNRELERNRAELDRQNTLKNRFLAMAAHDLKRPISVIQSSAELLIEEIGEEIGEEHSQYLGMIARRSQAMTKIVNDFLDYSAIEAGRFEIHPTATRLDDILTHCIELARIDVKNKNVRFEFGQCDAMPSQQLDEGKIEQVIINLLGNAVAHSPAGGTVYLTCQRGPSGLTITVEDEGLGIPTAELESIFKPFWRGSAPRQGNGEGQGLGLAIAQKIAAAHNGRIWAENRPEGGARFSLYLPI